MLDVQNGTLYHHDHKDAFDKMYLKHYMAVAEARCGMVPSGSTKPKESVHLVVKSGLSSSMLSQADRKSVV